MACSALHAERSIAVGPEADFERAQAGAFRESLAESVPSEEKPAPFRLVNDACQAAVFARGEMMERQIQFRIPAPEIPAPQT
jgi:hypothetical protein